MGDERKDGDWVVAPCTNCGDPIEDEWRADTEWICCSCWPRIERERLRAQLAASEKVVEAARRIANLAPAIGHVSLPRLIAELREELDALDAAKR
jgi:hypothetical protein